MGFQPNIIDQKEFVRPSIATLPSCRHVSTFGRVPNSEAPMADEMADARGRMVCQRRWVQETRAQVRETPYNPSIGPGYATEAVAEALWSLSGLLTVLSVQSR